MKILAVDDDPFILQILKAILTSSGFTDVIFTESAEQAAQIISQASPPFDCMLIDMRMPGATGGDLCSWVRKIPEYEDTPILMVTALAEKSDIDLAFAAGASDYVTKPIVASDLTARLDKVRRQNEKPEFCEPKARDALAKSVETNRIDFYQPMWLGGINSEIDLDALEKYIFQLSKSGLLSMEAFSFAIKDAAKIHSSCTPEDFMIMLKGVGSAISQCLPAPQLFISYAGYGAFTGVAEMTQNSELSWRETERDIQKKLEDLQVPSSIGDPIPVTPYMSPPQKLGMWNGQSAVDVLYRVIGDAEARCGSSLLST